MYAVFHPPNFPAQAAAHERPELRKCPFVLLDGEPSAETVFAANKAARALGVEVGMSRLQAESFPEVISLPRIREREKAAHTTLYTIARMFSPRIEYVEEHPGTARQHCIGAVRATPFQLGSLFIGIGPVEYLVFYKLARGYGTKWRACSPFPESASTSTKNKALPEKEERWATSPPWEIHQTRQ